MLQRRSLNTQDSHSEVGHEEVGEFSTASIGRLSSVAYIQI